MTVASKNAQDWLTNTNINTTTVATSRLMLNMFGRFRMYAAFQGHLSAKYFLPSSRLLRFLQRLQILVVSHSFGICRSLGLSGNNLDGAVPQIPRWMITLLTEGPFIESKHQDL